MTTRLIRRLRKYDHYLCKNVCTLLITFNYQSKTTARPIIMLPRDLVMFCHQIEDTLASA